MKTETGIVLGKKKFAADQAVLRFDQSCRHGLIAGATGSGKTVSARVIAEGFSEKGIPVVFTDIKGDVSAETGPGLMNDNVKGRLESNGMNPDDFSLHGYPVRFLDVYGEKGTPIRAEVSDFGPLLLSRLLSLSDAQEGVLNIVFKAADDKGWMLSNLADLNAMIAWVADHKDEVEDKYGHVSPQSAAALKRSLLALENAEADVFFGQPAFQISDFFEKEDGRGVITLIEAGKLFMNPLLYSAFLLWLLSELYETLPEAGALDEPRLVFMVDEAHLLFDDAPKVLVDKVSQIVRLIRSKGVALIFISQSPSDLPDAILSQLQNRMVHSLQAYTPAEKKKLKAASDGFRENPAFKTMERLTGFGTGEALVSFLDEKGVPQPVDEILVLPVQSGFTALSEKEMDAAARKDRLDLKYREMVDPRSAYEIIQEEKEEEDRIQEMQEQQKALEKEEKKQQRSAGTGRPQPQSAFEKSAKKAARSAARNVGRQTGRAISRGIMKNANKSVQQAAGSFLGSMVSDIFAGFFK